jgi:hypothetical protein
MLNTRAPVVTLVKHGEEKLRTVSRFTAEGI